MGIHAGHRERVRQRYLETGLKGFDDVNVLELLLFYAMPRQDTNPIAHALLDHFGSLYQVLEAPVEEPRVEAIPPVAVAPLAEPRLPAITRMEPMRTAPHRISQILA